MFVIYRSSGFGMQISAKKGNQHFSGVRCEPPNSPFHRENHEHCSCSGRPLQNIWCISGRIWASGRMWSTGTKEILWRGTRWGPRLGVDSRFCRSARGSQSEFGNPHEILRIPCDEFSFEGCSCRGEGCFLRGDARHRDPGWRPAWVCRRGGSVFWWARRHLDDRVREDEYWSYRYIFSEISMQLSIRNHASKFSHFEIFIFRVMFWNRWDY